MLLHSLDDGNFPKENDFTESWKRMNPNAEIIHWTFSDAEKILESEHPELLTVYRSPHMGVVGRSGILRFCIMEKFGGCYMDKDIECLKPLDELEGNGLVLQQKLVTLPMFIADYMMIAPPRHPLFTEILGRDWARTRIPDEERTATTIWGATSILQTALHKKIPFTDVELDKTFVRHHSTNSWKGKK